MTQQTEKSPGFGPLELRSGIAAFPGWRGLQRTGDTVIKQGRFYRLWNGQISDGEIECRGGQVAFADLNTESITGRPNCITSIFSTNNEWPDIGEQAEIWVGALDDDHYHTYRGDLGVFSTIISAMPSKTQRWLRDGVDNTSSGLDNESATNSSVRIRDRVYVADLDGGIRYLAPGTASYTVLAAAGVQFAADKSLLAMLHRGLLVICGVDTLKTYNIDTNTWSVIAMPAATTGFVPAQWTVFASDDCLYIWGTVPGVGTSDAKLIKFDGTTATVTYTAPVVDGNTALGCASNNGQITVSLSSANGVSPSIIAYYSLNGTSFTASTVPGHNGPSSMVVADGMIWSLGAYGETEEDAYLLYSYDGSEWLSVLFVETTSDGGVFVSKDIIQIAPVDNTVEDTTAEP